MRYSHLLGKTKHTAPHDADTPNAKYLIQGGFVDQVAAGIYTYLPLGLRVMHKIMKIVRKEMNAIGGQEIVMPALHPSENWVATGRDVTCADILYRTEGHGNKTFFLGQTHEEIVTPMAKKFIESYKDLPFMPYQIQTKFRNEPRAKSGVLRGREFTMKDMYSFHTDADDLNRFYELVIEAYLRVFDACGCNAYVIEASGGSFTDEYSHEFQVLTPAGEDTIYYSEKHGVGFNEEVKEGREMTHQGEPLKEGKAVEAGNIFKLGTKYATDFGLTYASKDGKKLPVHMGCYGIGISRLVGTIVEANHDDKGIIWPSNVAPFLIHLVTIGKSDELMQSADRFYREMMEKGYEVLFDDRDEGAGKKLKDADLIGCPLRLVLSERTLGSNQIEWKLREYQEVKMVDLDKLFSELEFFIS